MLKSMWLGRLWIGIGRQQSPSWFFDRRRIPTSGPCVAIGFGQFAIGVGWLNM